MGADIVPALNWERTRPLAGFEEMIYTRKKRVVKRRQIQVHGLARQVLCEPLVGGLVDVRRRRRFGLLAREWRNGSSGWTSAAWRSLLWALPRSERREASLPAFVLTRANARLCAFRVKD